VFKFNLFKKNDNKPKFDFPFDDSRGDIFGVFSERIRKKTGVIGTQYTVKYITIDKTAIYTKIIFVPDKRRSGLFKYFT